MSEPTIKTYASRILAKLGCALSAANSQGRWPHIVKGVLPMPTSLRRFDFPMLA